MIGRPNCSAFIFIFVRLFYFRALQFITPSYFFTLLLSLNIFFLSLFLFLCIYSSWKVICFSFQIPRMGAISQTWAVNLGRSAQRSPRNRLENWNQNSLTTTIWHGLDVTKSLSTLTSQRDKYVQCWACFHMLLALETNDLLDKKK